MIEILGVAPMPCHPFWRRSHDRLTTYAYTLLHHAKFKNAHHRSGKKTGITKENTSSLNHGSLPEFLPCIRTETPFLAQVSRPVLTRY